MLIRNRLPQYAYLMRLHKPIGILLLLWPTLSALWVASKGSPSPRLLTIFILGTIFMRSAGCVMNDYADQHFDAHVMRTKMRPLVKGTVKPKEALLLTALLGGLSFLLVLFCNGLTIFLAFIGAALAVIYPFLKRITNLPQFGLGAAFAWGVPMAFAAETNTVPFAGWFLFLSSLIWPVMYDTLYAMVDRSDDKKIGVKSTAILFGSFDRFIIALLQLLFISLLAFAGLLFHLKPIYYASLFLSSLFFIYEQWLIKDRCEAKCFKAFLNNNWVGLVIFAGIVMSYS